jgi:predicted Zn-dependent protease
MPREMDALADRLAINMLARGGYRLDGVIPFWQRLAQQVPEGVSDGHTALHPATAQRLAAMEKSVAEIHRRRTPKKVGKARK